VNSTKSRVTFVAEIVAAQRCEHAVLISLPNWKQRKVRWLPAAHLNT
jgi:hypothetical protein